MKSRNYFPKVQNKKAEKKNCIEAKSKKKKIYNYFS